MPPGIELNLSNFNILVAFLGGFLSLFGLVSYLLKEKFYLSEALISLLTGVTFSPHAANFIRPLQYALGSQKNLNDITLYFTRLVLAVQLVLAGLQLPSKYLKTEWKSLSILLGPGMCAMWVSTSLIVWAMVPNLSFLHALAVSSCVTPTDPVLSNTIVKGKFADKNIPKDLQRIIIAESGANDGLGYPFQFLALYLIAYTQGDGLGAPGGVPKAMGYWFGITWGYTIILSTIYGFVVGWVFKEALHWAEKRKYVDRESFLVFAIALALFVEGTTAMIGSDDVLASFIAGSAFNWDDWFRAETEDDSLQPTIDMLLNVAIFAWYGAICPWHLFAYNNVIPLYRLVFLGILVLLLRRLPFVLLVHKHIVGIHHIRHAWFAGFFGPIGVSAVFYLYTSYEYLESITVDGVQRQDAAQLQEVFQIVVWFMVICSIIGHGLTIPVAKLGIYLPRTISRATTGLSDENSSPFHIRQDAVNEAYSQQIDNRLEEGANKDVIKSSRISPPVKIGGSEIQDDLVSASGLSTQGSRTFTTKILNSNNSIDGNHNSSFEPPIAEHDMSDATSSTINEDHPHLLKSRALTTQSIRFPD